MTSVLAALALFLAAMAVRAEEMKCCPPHAGTSVVRVLDLYSIKDKRTFAVYSDGADQAIELRAGCRVTPVDVARDAREDGMHECRESGPAQGRCHIVYP